MVDNHNPVHGPMLKLLVALCLLSVDASLAATAPICTLSHSRSVRVSTANLDRTTMPHTRNALFGSRRAYREGLMTGSVLSRCPPTGGSSPTIVVAPQGRTQPNHLNGCPPCPPCLSENQGMMARRHSLQHPIVSASQNSLVLRVSRSRAPTRVFYQGRWWVKK